MEIAKMLRKIEKKNGKRMVKNGKMVKMVIPECKDINKGY